MPDHVDRLTPMDLAEIRLRCERGQVRSEDGLSLLSELEALREHIAELRTASLHRLIGLVPSGDLRNRLAEWVAARQEPEGVSADA